MRVTQRRERLRKGRVGAEGKRSRTVAVRRVCRGEEKERRKTWAERGRGRQWIGEGS